MCTPTQERMNYEESLKDYRDMYSVMKTQLEKGRAEGFEEANLANARKMKAKGFAIADISDITGLPIEEIETL